MNIDWEVKYYEETKKDSTYEQWDQQYGDYRNVYTNEYVNWLESKLSKFAPKG